MPLPTSTQHMRVSNKATALREMQTFHKIHMAKLDAMKPSIDMSSPKIYSHVAFNAKRMQMESERNSAIERENKILLGKMYSIMSADSKYNIPPAATVSSLNMTVRKQEYDRIARENQAIMQRILQREPNFNRLAIEEEWKVTQRYLNNISEYPFMLGNLPPATRKKTLRPMAYAGEAAETEAMGYSAPPAAYVAPPASAEPVYEAAPAPPAAPEPAYEAPAAPAPAPEPEPAYEEPAAPAPAPEPEPAAPEPEAEPAYEAPPAEAPAPEAEPAAEAAPEAAPEAPAE